MRFLYLNAVQTLPAFNLSAVRSLSIFYSCAIRPLTFFLNPRGIRPYPLKRISCLKKATTLLVLESVKKRLIPRLVYTFLPNVHYAVMLNCNVRVRYSWNGMINRIHSETADVIRSKIHDLLQLCLEIETHYKLLLQIIGRRFPCKLKPHHLPRIDQNNRSKSHVFVFPRTILENAFSCC